MPLPTGRQVHVDTPLTNISIAYVQRNANNPFGYVADRAFPIVPVSKRSDVYYKYNKADWFRGGSKKRGPATESAGGGFRLTTDNYFCNIWALHDDVAWEDVANQDAALDLNADAAEWITQNMLIDREIEWANTYFKPGVWANEWTGGTDFYKWDDYTNSDPGRDIEVTKARIERTTGFTPNTMIVGRAVHSHLKFHPEIQDQYKHTTADSITAAMLARVFEIERYMVCGGIKNTSVEGDPNADDADNFDFIQGNHIWLGYAAPSPSLRRPSAGYTFAWNAYRGAAFAAPQIERWDMREKKATRIEGELAYVHKLVASDMGAFFVNAVDGLNTNTPP